MDPQFECRQSGCGGEVFPALALDVSNKEEEDLRVKTNTHCRLPMNGQECQNKIASHRALSSLLRCGVHMCVCVFVCVCVCVCMAASMQHGCAFSTQSERESNMGKGLG